MVTKFLLAFLKIFWPIETRELKKFLPLAAIMFCVLFNYSAVRILKDSLVVPSIGAEALSFIKLWAVLPSAVLFVVLYNKMLNLFTEEKVFYLISGAFLIFFAVFAFYMVPNAEILHPSASYISDLAFEYPNIKWFIFIAGKWTYALFYIFAELWGSVMLSLLFWQFANKITTSDEAKRFYPMFGLIANISLMLVGIILGRISKSVDNEIISSSEIISKTTILILIMGSMIVIIFRWMHKKVLTDHTIVKSDAPKKEKKKLSIKESFNLILHSKYLGYIALLVLCYGVSINLVEGAWKAKVRELYPTQDGYFNYMSHYIKWTGVGSFIFFIIGGNILRKLGWYFSALTTPIMVLVTGVSFFIFSNYSNSLDHILTAYIGISALGAAVFFGFVQNILSKATKYSLFDPTKEMAYIPLDKELKTKGKAAVDVIGGRLGKSGGALIQVGIFSIFHTTNMNDISPYLMVIFTIVVILWIISVVGLNKEYKKLVTEVNEV